jgi:hypothetical protein
MNMCGLLKNIIAQKLDAKEVRESGNCVWII